MKTVFKILIFMGLLIVGAAGFLVAAPVQTATVQPDGGNWLSIPVAGYGIPAGETLVLPAEDGIREGYRLELGPGEGELLVHGEPVAAEGPAVVTVEYGLAAGAAQISAVALNLEGETPDGQLGYTTVSAAADPENPGAVRRVHTIYSPPSGQFAAAVQYAADADAELILYSVSVHPLVPAGGTAVETAPPGGFDSEPAGMAVNVNGDDGTAEWVEAAGAVDLSANGNGGAANAGVTAALAPGAEVLLTASAEISRIAGSDGTAALVMVNGAWNCGVFAFLDSVPEAPDTFTLMAGGGFVPSDSDTMVFVQNGGGAEASTMRMDNLGVETLSLKSIEGLEPIEPKTVEESLAATFVMPQTLYAGSLGSYSFAASRAGTREPLNIPYSVAIEKDGKSIPLGGGQTGAQGFASSQFTVPETEAGQWAVTVGAFGQTVLKGQVQVQDGGLLFIETDKPVYKPGQTIQGRVVTLNNALTPLRETVELSIADAKGIKIHRETLETNEYGVAAFELPLATELNFGTWKITAQIGNDIRTERDIEVDRYVLPAFEVDLSLDKNWYLVNEKVTGVVSSRFFFGKPVQGGVKIEALRYVGTWETYATAEGRLEDGRFEFELPEVGYTAGTPGEENAGTLQLKVTVTDDTGREEKTDQIVRITESGVNLKLISESPVIKPGLAQELLIVTETPGNEPLSMDVTLEIAYFGEDGSDLGTINETVQTENGMAPYTMDVPAGTSFANVGARVKAENREVSENLVLNAVYSPGAYYIHLRQQSDGILAVGDEAVFEALATADGSVFYDVFANGTTVFSNVTTGREIRFPVTPNMAPSAKVVAYMIQPNNEVSVDVLPFDVDASNVGTLEADFGVEEARPGDPVTLSLRSAGESMIGLAIVDESVFALAEGRLNMRNVFAELERFYQEPRIEVHENPDEGPIPGPRPMPMPVVEPGANPSNDFYGNKGARDIFADNNLQILTTKTVTVPEGDEIDPWQLWEKWNRRGGDVPVMFPLPLPPVLEEVDAGAPEGGGSGQFQEPDRVRTFFPETWLWRPMLMTDATGAAALDLNAPDSITNWKLHAVSTSPAGLGIAEGSLRVFQDFFVEPDLPYAVTRGDEFPLRVRVFNYVDSEQEIRITLEDAEGLGLEGDPVQTVTVPPQGLSSVSFKLKPSEVGSIPVSLIAQSAARADAIVKNLRVEPEGVRREFVHNGTLREATEVTIDFSFPPVIDPLRDELIPPIREEEIVPDSERFRVSVTPSLVGQAMNGLGDLLGMPYGCGEQNMIFLAPDVEILRYLDKTNQSAPEIRAKAEFFITTGYQRQLTFQRSDGSFSAFGEQDEEGSLWLTAFVLNTFSAAREIRTIDDSVLSRAADWILGHQKDDGSWEPVGFVIHSELVGGLEGNLSLTAYTALSLLEYGGADSAKTDLALDYLAGYAGSEAPDSYSLSMIAYALTKAGHPAAGAAVDNLLDRAIADGDGLHWEPHPIETTGYAALSLMALDRVEAQPALTWLSSQRNGLGGYGSTQDTVVALKALTAAAAEQSRDLNASIEVLVDGELAHTFAVNSDNFDVMQSLEIPAAETITLRQTGTGRVLYQAVRAFNVPVPEEPPRSGIELTVDYSADHVAVDDIVDVDVRVLYTGGFEIVGEDGETIMRNEKTGMAIVDVSVPTGFALVQESVERAKEHELIKRVEQAGRKVIFYIDHLTHDEPFEFGFQVKAQYPVRADGGTSSAYLYYDESSKDESAAGEMVIE